LIWSRSISTVFSTTRSKIHFALQGLFDRHEFLTWIVETFESIPLYDEIALSYFMPFILQYLEVRAIKVTVLYEKNWQCKLTSCFLLFVEHVKTAAW